MSQQGKNAKREGARSHELYMLQALNRVVNAITGQGQPPAPSGIATEATLQAVLTAVDSMRDYEVRLVTDSDSPEVTWLEVRYWDVQTGALGAPEYYLPGSSVPGTPTGAITYIPTSTLLSQILAELQSIVGFYHIENDDDIISTGLDLPTNINLLYGEYDSGEGTQWERIQIDEEGRLLGLDNIRSWIETLNAKFNSLGQKASGASTPVVLSTEQEVILNAIKTAIEALDLDADSLSQEATQLLVKSVLDAIKLDTANLDVTLSSRLNTLGRKAETASAPVVLSNEDFASLEAIRVAVQNLDVDLDGIATEVTLAALLAAFNAKDFASQTTLASVLTTLQTIDSTVATETTLAALNAKLNTLGQKASAASAPVVLSTEQEAILEAIKTSVDNIDIDLGTGGLALETTQVAIENLITSTNALLTTIDADTSNLDVLLSTRASDASVLATNALLTTIDGILDAIKVDTGNLVVDLAAIEVLITSTNSLLTTIDAVLDAIKVDTGNILLDTTAIKNAVEILDNAVGTNGTAHGASQQGVRALGSDGTNDQQLLTDANGRLQVDIVGGSTSGGALEATQLLVEDHVGNIETQLTAKSITPNLIRTTASGSIPSGSYSFTIANVGAADADILGGTDNLKAGETVSFDAGALNNTYGAIAYDATGTELLITYNS